MTEVQDDPTVEIYLVHTVMNHVRACPTLELAEGSMKPGDVLYLWTGRLGQLQHLGRLQTIEPDEEIQRAIRARAEEQADD